MKSITREQLIKDLEHASELITQRPWWRQNLIDEYNKAFCSIPRTPIYKTNHVVDEKGENYD